MQHAQSDDYVEMIHELQAAQNEAQQVIFMLAFPCVSETQPLRRVQFCLVCLQFV